MKNKSKRILASLLVVFMCIILILSSCGGSDEPAGSSSSTNASSGTGASSVPDQTERGSSDVSSVPDDDTKDSSTDSSAPDDGTDNVKPPVVDLTTEWRGQTLNILAATWETENDTAPWAQAELSAGEGDIDVDSGYGSVINDAVLLREKRITEEYGVALNWISARGSQISNLLTESTAVGSPKYHIAMPRVTEAQSLVENGLVYDLANREYIDLNKSYYSQAAIEAYTVNNRTLFVSGDFGAFEKASSYVTFYNVDFLSGLKPELIPDFYTLVKSGSWTVEEMTSVAKHCGKNSNEAEWTDNDFYGFGTQGVVQFYGYEGIRQVSVENGRYKLFESSPYFGDIVECILEINGATYTRTEWNSSPARAFADGRILFYNGPLQELASLDNQEEPHGIAILPNPKVNAGQDKYYTLVGESAVLMCVPKATDDRGMSDAFVEILSQTGEEILTPAYLESIKASLDPETADRSMEFLTDYVFEGLVYDQGYLYGVLTQAFENAHSGASGMIPDNTDILASAEATVAEWNKNWLAYTE